MLRPMRGGLGIALNCAIEKALCWMLHVSHSQTKERELWIGKNLLLGSLLELTKGKTLFCLEYLGKDQDLYVSFEAKGASRPSLFLSGVQVAQHNAGGAIMVD